MCRAEFSMSCASLFVRCVKERNESFYSTGIFFESLISRARNAAVAAALHYKSDYLLFIDADIGFDARDVFKLLDHDKDVVCGAYPKKYYNKQKISYLSRHRANSFESDDWKSASVDFATEISENFLINVDVSEFDKNFELIRNINAKKIDISNKKWSIKNATTLNKNNEIKENIDLFINSNFDLEKINSLYSNLSSLTIWELYKLKKDYVDLGYSSIEINTQIQKIISFPLYVALMTIIATIVMLNIKPNKSKVFYLVLGIALSVIIFYLSNFINILGKNERLPMILAIWLPLIILSIFNMIGMVRLNEK